MNEKSQSSGHTFEKAVSSLFDDPEEEKETQEIEEPEEPNEK